MAKLRSLLLVFLAWCSSAQAFPPDEGWWWNPAEGGRGWNMEYQNGLMFISTFIYGPNGEQVWYTSTGTYNPANRTFTGTFDLSRNGQCFGCPYRSPQTQISAGGPVTIVFDSAVQARLTHNGGTITIQRFVFNFPTLNSYLYGGWAISRQVGTIIDGETLVLDGRLTDAQGREFITGRRDLTTNIVVASFDPALSRWAILLDSTSTNYKFWVMDMTTDAMQGNGWLYPKTGSPTGSGNLSVGFRLLYRNELGAAVVNANDDMPARNASESNLMGNAPKGTVSADVLVLASMLEEVLERQKALAN